MEISDVQYQTTLQQLFDELKKEVAKIDTTLEGAVDAEKVKTSKSIENLLILVLGFKDFKLEK